MPRIQGLSESGLLNNNVLLKTGISYVFSVTIAFRGATVGDTLVRLRDGTDGSAPIEVVFIAPTANGTLTKEWTQGKEFETGLFYEEGVISDVNTEITYK